MCLVNCVVHIILGLYFSFKTSKFVGRPLLWGWTWAAAPAIFTVLVPGGVGPEQVWAAHERHSASLAAWLFLSDGGWGAGGDRVLSPVTHKRREQMVPCTATLMLIWAYCSSGQHQAGLLQRARNCPHASPSLWHVGNSETVKVLPGVFASHYSTWC